MRRVTVSLRSVVETSIMIAAFAFASPDVNSLRVGLALATTGLALRIWTAGYGYNHGRRLRPIGARRFIRHPYFAGSALMVFGLVVAARQSGLAIAAVPLLTFIYWNAAKLEEIQNYDSEQHQYLHQVPAFLPSFYKVMSPPQDVKFSWREAFLRSGYREAQATAALIIVYFFFKYWADNSLLRYSIAALLAVGATLRLVLSTNRPFMVWKGVRR